MASLKDLKKRIGSVKNTQQTTRAMKLVSAAKLRRAQEAVLAQRPYALEIRYLLTRLARAVEDKSQSTPLLASLEGVPAESRRVLMVAMSSDRGLCGNFNSQVIRNLDRWIQEQKKQVADVKVFALGRRVGEFIQRRYPEALWRREEWGNRVTSSQVAEYTNEVVNAVESGAFHEVWVTFTQFENAITQTLKMERLLPVLGHSLEETAEEAGQDIDLALIKPNAEGLLERLLARFTSSQMFRCALESQASEHGARMTAMSNATNNAGEMIEKLTLSYNKQRQANITSELSEITSGSEALKA